MKRHKALQGLSSEHHHGLVWARRLGLAANKGKQEDMPALVQGFLEFWGEHLNSHFRKEEEILFPHYFVSRGEVTGVVLETQRQHVMIRSDILKLKQESENGEISRERLMQISDLLTRHVRFEERELFEEIQNNCTETELQRLTEFPELRKKS